MKILGICGSHNKKGNTACDWVMATALQSAKERGAQVDSLRLVDYTIKPCATCHLCMCDHECPVLKDPADQADEVFKRIAVADGLIFASPVYSYHQPAIVLNLIQRARYFHEVERGRYMRLKSLRSVNNPFSGKPIGTIVVSATIGNETALADLMHNFRGLGAAPIVCGGISLLDASIGAMYKSSKNEKIQESFVKSMPKFEDNEAAKMLAGSIGLWVYQAHQSAVFQKIKHYIKL